MTRTICITALLAVLACTAVLISRSGGKAELLRQLKEERQTIARLESDIARPVDPAVLRPSVHPDADAGDAESAAIADARAASTPEERIGRALEQIDILLDDLDDISRSPAEFFKIMPDLLRLVQHLDLDELVGVAEGLDAPMAFGGGDSKSAVKMLLYMLAAEQDPQRFMKDEKLMANRQMRSSMINALAERDPAAAQRWLESSDMPANEKKRASAMMALRLLRKDLGAGLEMVRAQGKEGMEVVAMLSTMPMSAEKTAELTEALDDPKNAELRPVLLNTVIMAASFADGIEGARARVEELGLTAEEVSSYLAESAGASMATEPEETLRWLAEVQSPEQLSESIPQAISNWARNDYNAAGEWLGKMEPSSTKDAAISKYAHAILQVDPKAAVLWAAEIADQDQRMNTLRTVHDHWRTDDADAADAWLKESGIELPEVKTEDAPKATQDLQFQGHPN